MAKHTQTIRQQVAIISIILLSIVQFKSPIIILFPFPSFLFCIIFQSFKKAPSPQASCSLVLYPEGALTENSIIRGSNLKGYKPPFWISVNLSNTFKTQMKQKKHSFCVATSRREKDGA